MNSAIHISTIFTEFTLSHYKADQKSTPKMFYKIFMKSKTLILSLTHIHTHI